MYPMADFEKCSDRIYIWTRAENGHIRWEFCVFTQGKGGEVTLLRHMRKASHWRKFLVTQSHLVLWVLRSPSRSQLATHIRVNLMITWNTGRRLYSASWSSHFLLREASIKENTLFRSHPMAGALGLQNWLWGHAKELFQLFQKVPLSFIHPHTPSRVIFFPQSKV